MLTQRFWQTVVVTLATVFSINSFIAAQLGTTLCQPVSGKVEGLSMRLPWATGDSYVAQYGYCARHHQGYQVDFPMDEGTPILAVADGFVIQVGNYVDNCNSPNCVACPGISQVTAGGVFVKIQHTADDGTRYNSAYLHLHELSIGLVNCGDYVEQGQLIGFSGNTGCSSGPHLHFHIRRAVQSNICPIPQNSEVENVRPVPMHGQYEVGGEVFNIITDFVQGYRYTAIDPPAPCEPYWEVIADPSGFDEGGVYILGEYNNDLIAGGSFTTIGDVETSQIARWDGVNWNPLGGGVQGNQVLALSAFDSGQGSELYVGGQFIWVEGMFMPYIARWNGQQWSSVGSGVGGGVFTFIVFDDGSDPALYAGGLFTSAGGVVANRIAKWDGQQWSSLGSGVSGSFPQVYALAVFDDGSGSALYVAGSFSSAGGVPANNIAKWNGRSWSAVGNGLNNIIEALAVFETVGVSALYAGGVPVGNPEGNKVMRWDGLQWFNIPNHISWPAYNAVRALAVFDDGSGDALYAGGDVQHARWDGVQWHDPCPCPFGGGARTMLPFDSDDVYALYIGSSSGQYITAWLGCGNGLQSSRISGDLNRDGKVDGKDLEILLSVWGFCDDLSNRSADLTGDGVVDASDLIILLTNWV